MDKYDFITNKATKILEGYHFETFDDHYEAWIELCKMYAYKFAQMDLEIEMFAGRKYGKK